MGDPDLVIVNPSGRAAIYQALGASLAADEIRAMTAHRLERRYA